MSFSRYPEYKDSGVEWLGEVPAHWQLDRLKRSIADCKNGIWGDEAQEDEYDIPCVRVADFNRQQLTVVLSDPTIRNVTEKERVGRLLSKGDLLLEKSGGGENQPVGCVVLYNDQRAAVCSNFVAKMQIAAGMDSSYWRYVHAAAYAIRLTTGSINQTSGIQNLDQNRYFNERVAFPPFEEQQTIAAFLDGETAKIDALVAEQEKLIALLKEKRQAVISHAVTKGLDPNVPMKDSGIEWLGEVPVHWSVTPFYSVVAERDEPNAGMREDNLLSLSYGRIVQKDINSNEGLLPESFETYQIVRPGDIIFRLTDLQNDKRSLRTAIVEETGIITSAYVATKPINIEPQYLNHLLRAYDVTKVFYSMGGGLRQSMKFSDLKRLPTLLPPPEEQASIADFLDRETAKLDALTAEAQHGIELLKERRSALISAAVTGKIDVRGLAAIKEAA